MRSWVEVMCRCGEPLMADRLMTLKEWRRYRDMAGILIDLVVEAGNGDEAWSIYHAWRDGKLTYRQALARLKKLAREAK